MAGTGRYIAVIGDMTGSRKLDRSLRTPLDGEVAALLRLWNKRPGVVSDFAMPHREEFVGLLGSYAALPEILWDVATVLPEAGAMVGIGVGDPGATLAGANLEPSGKAAYGRARTAIVAAGPRGPRGGYFQGFGDSWDDSLGAMARTLHRQRIGWTMAQRRVAAMLRSGLAQTRIADELGVSRQNISKHATAAGWAVHADLERAFARCLEKAWAAETESP